MSTITLTTPALGEVPVVSGPAGSYLLLPLRGAWTSTVELHGLVQPAAGDPATLTFYQDAIGGAAPPVPATFAGTVRRAAVASGNEQLVVSLVGGAGGMSTKLGPAEHITGTTPIPLGIIVAKVLADAGEQLGAGVAQALAAYTVPRWHRLGGLTGRQTLELLTYLVGLDSGVDLGFRVQPDGTWWAGVETWATAPTARYSSPDLDDGRIIYAPDGATLMPGTVVDGYQVVEVLYTLATPALRAEARHPVDGDPPRRVELAAYARTYAATVAAQSSSTGLLDLLFEDVAVGDMRGAPFRMGIPGATATIPTGSALRVRFEQGDPRLPYAFDFDAAAWGSGVPFALRGDAIDAGTITVQDPSGAACTVTWAAPGAQNSGHGVPVELTGKITGPGHKYARGISGP